MKITYRKLLSAIQVANDLTRVYDLAAHDPIRWNGTAEEKDQADARIGRADDMLDKEIDWDWV
jgi:hypothetical protein